MNDFKHSILTLMHTALDSRKITKVQYVSDQSLFLSYDELIMNPFLFESESIFFIDESRQSSLDNSSCNSLIAKFSAFEAPSFKIFISSLCSILNISECDNLEN